MRVFGSPLEWPEQDLVGFTDEIDAMLALTAYAEGLFPMPLYWGTFSGEMGWWSPVDRAILPTESFRLTRSLRKSAKHYTVTVDQAFLQVLDQCGDPRRPDGWIDERIRCIYTELFDAGHVHSVETWNAEGILVGGLYGVSFGGLFAGESMFHHPELGRDASKVALWRLVELLEQAECHDGLPRLLDVQWQTDHLQSMGSIEIDRGEYLDLLVDAIQIPDLDWKTARLSGHQSMHA